MVMSGTTKVSSSTVVASLGDIVVALKKERNELAGYKSQSLSSIDT